MHTRTSTTCGAVYGPKTLALLLKGANETQAGEWIAGLAPRVAFAVRAGIAVHPEVASGVEALLAAARGALDRASASTPVVVAKAAHANANYTLPHGSTHSDGALRDDYGIVAQSPSMRQVLSLAHRAARSELPVLVLGETGTGKEVLAREIHARSRRAEQAFRVVNCGGLPPSLLESTLFGHEKGAFTGAGQAHAGLFEQANGGTLFLDEVGELSPAAQAALLRVLEGKTLTRLGASTERKVDVRVLAATHRDLSALCEQGRFREDLLHRLNAVTLVLPPLRERSDEIPMFVERFLRGRDLPADCARMIAPAALERLHAYHWPGNVRQLKNVVERAAVLALSDTIDVDDLPEELHDTGADRDSRRARPLTETLPAPAPEPAASPQSMRESLQEHEAALLRQALAQSEGNRTHAARLLRMPLRTLMKRLKEYRIE